MYTSLFLSSSADELIDPIFEVLSNVTAVRSFERQASLITASSVGYILRLDVLAIDPRDESRIRYSRRYILITIVQSKQPSNYAFL